MMKVKTETRKVVSKCECGNMIRHTMGGVARKIKCKRCGRDGWRQGLKTTIKEVEMVSEGGMLKPLQGEEFEVKEPEVLEVKEEFPVDTNPKFFGLDFAENPVGEGMIIGVDYGKEGGDVMVVSEVKNESVNSEEPVVAKDSIR